jgi:hypothetical protein
MTNVPEGGGVSGEITAFIAGPQTRRAGGLSGGLCFTHPPTDRISLTIGCYFEIVFDVQREIK